MKRRTFLTASGAAFVGAGFRSAWRAHRKRSSAFGCRRISRGLHAFVTVEYSQDSATTSPLVNARGGVNGYQILADVSDHANDLPRALEGL